SITLDADKMGRLPYPSGIYLCRKDLMQYVNRKVNYVRGNEDCTVSGSRSCLAPVMAYYLYRAGGLEKQRDYVQERINERDRLVELIKGHRTEEPHLIDLFPRSPYVNFAPMAINIYKGHIPRNLLEKINNNDPKLDEVEKVDLMDWQGRLEAYGRVTMTPR
ncbi:MAG: hypothetical protein Q8M94_05720, partial [Ignavibacteria bacterium]|nr:hypothetical protein [Ignavibacteria bacterium]